MKTTVAVTRNPDQRFPLLLRTVTDATVGFESVALCYYVNIHSLYILIGQSARTLVVQNENQTARSIHKESAGTSVSQSIYGVIVRKQSRACD